MIHGPRLSHLIRLNARVDLRHRMEQPVTDSLSFVGGTSGRPTTIVQVRRSVVFQRDALESDDIEFNPLGRGDVRIATICASIMSD